MYVCMYVCIYVHELGVFGWLRLINAQNDEEQSLSRTPNKIYSHLEFFYLLLLNAESTGNGSLQDQSCF